MRWPPFIVVPCVGATRPAQGERKGGDGSARRQSDRLGARSCDVEAQRQRASDGELDRGGIQVSTRRNEGCQHTAPTQLRARVGSATQGPRQRAFGRVSSASGAGGARLRR
jgi:hypothetical protein